MQNGAYKAFLADQPAGGWHLEIVRALHVSWSYGVPDGYRLSPLTDRMGSVSFGKAESRVDIGGREFALAYTLPRQHEDGRVAIELDRAEVSSWVSRSNSLTSDSRLRLAASTDEAMDAAWRFAQDQSTRRGYQVFLDVLECGAVFVTDETLPAHPAWHMPEPFSVHAATAVAPRA